MTESPTDAEAPKGSEPTVESRDPTPGGLGYQSSLSDLILWRDVSVRLGNCIRSDAGFARMTIGEYAEQPNVSFSESLRVRNMGRKTAWELYDLVLSVARTQDNPVKTSLPEKTALDNTAQKARQLVLGLLRDLNFPSAPLQLELGTRLRNVLEEFARSQQAGLAPATAFTTVGDAVERWNELASTLITTKNMGRKSLLELKLRVEELMNRRLMMVIPTHVMRSPLHIETLMQALDPGLVEALLDLPLREESNLDADERADLMHEILHPDREGEVRDLIIETLASLSAKEQAVIVRRYGLHGHRLMTLEEVGTEFYVTRERVRQIELKALKRLSNPSRRVLFDELLDQETDGLWNQLTDGSELLVPADLEDRRDTIDPLLDLAITVVHGSLGDWVAASGVPFVVGWIRSLRPLEAIRSNIREVIDHLEERALPRSVASIADALQIEIQDVILAVRCSGSLRLVEDYVIRGFVGPQARRTVGLHKVFSELQQADLLDFTLVLDLYRSRYPEDDVTARIVELQMQRAPHLFACAFDAVWWALPERGVAFRQSGTVLYNCRHQTSDREYENETIAHWLLSTLRAKGPMRGVDLRDEALAEIRQEIAASSIHAILLTNPIFVRLAPGLFGLQEHVAMLSHEGAAYPDTFFSINHCRYYTFARAAGEPMCLYPSWSYGFEAQLCKWVQHAAPIEMFRSLLHVANPPNWPVGQDEKNSWERMRASYAQYGQVPVGVSIREMKCPKVEDILAALAFLGTLGGLSWISVNRTAQRRLDNIDAAAGLALLIVLNGIKAEPHWQVRHLPAPGHTALFAKIASERARTGSLKWTEGNLRSALEVARTGLSTMELGWVDRQEALLLIDRMLEGGPIGTLDIEYTEPDELLGTDWAAQFQE